MELLDSRVSAEKLRDETLTVSSKVSVSLSESRSKSNATKVGETLSSVNSLTWNALTSVILFTLFSFISLTSVAVKAINVLSILVASSVIALIMLRSSFESMRCRTGSSPKRRSPPISVWFNSLVRYSTISN